MLRAFSETESSRHWRVRIAGTTLYNWKRGYMRDLVPNKLLEFDVVPHYGVDRVLLLFGISRAHACEPWV